MQCEFPGRRRQGRRGVFDRSTIELAGEICPDATSRRAHLGVDVSNFAANNAGPLTVDLR